MAYFTRESLRKVAGRRFNLSEGLSASVRKEVVASVGVPRYDIFLSHSSLNAEAVDEAYLALCALGYKVYLDRRDDSDLHPQRVTKDTAAQIRKRIGQCDCLLVATSNEIVNSRWVPWELGVADGAIGKVAALPVLASAYGAFKGSEYFDLYPKVEEGDGAASLVVNDGFSKKSLRTWINEPVSR